MEYKKFPGTSYWHVHIYVKTYIALVYFFPYSIMWSLKVDMFCVFVALKHYNFHCTVQPCVTQGQKKSPWYLHIPLFCPFPPPIVSFTEVGVLTVTLKLHSDRKRWTRCLHESQYHVVWSYLEIYIFLSLTAANTTMFAAIYQLWRTKTGWKTWNHMCVHQGLFSCAAQLCVSQS